jgi:hypothetical protein
LRLRVREPAGAQIGYDILDSASHIYSTEEDFSSLFAILDSKLSNSSRIRELSDVLMDVK